MAEMRLKLHHEAIRQTLKSDQVSAEVHGLAEPACEAANRWARAYQAGHRSGQPGPHFKVVTELGRNRARYTVRPATGFGVWLVSHDPAGFMACLDKARGTR